jgi:hypothetical protein
MRLWIRRVIIMADNGGKVGEAIGAILLGIIGGVALGAILEAVSKPKCPVCKQTIEKGVPVCPHCSSCLTWES